MPAAQTVTLFKARSAQDLDAVRRLFRAYADWLNIDLAYQGFEEELAALPGKYAPPSGELFLAGAGENPPCGCVALRPFGEEGWCEMKRLYVAPEGRGHGLGGALVEAVIGEGRALGYSAMVLDTLPSMRPAIGLYTRHGFDEIPAYYDTPVAGTVFFKKTL